MTPLDWLGLLVGYVEMTNTLQRKVGEKVSGTIQVSIKVMKLTFRPFLLVSHEPFANSNPQ